MELESVNSSDDQVTHATFASEKSKPSVSQECSRVLNIIRVLDTCSRYHFQTAEPDQNRYPMGRAKPV